MSKDWTGNSKTTFSVLGSSNHSERDRADHDYYATDPVAIDLLKQTGFFRGVKNIWEPACGGGHLSKRMLDLGYKVTSTDLYYHGYGVSDLDFLSIPEISGYDAIVTNPPYKYALEFCRKSIELGVPKVAMFLKLTFLEGVKRHKFFEKNPPRYIAVSVNRIQCALNGDPDEFKKSSAACYAWFIWEKGYTGKPEILWIKKDN